MQHTLVGVGKAVYDRIGQGNEVMQNGFNGIQCRMVEMSGALAAGMQHIDTHLQRGFEQVNHNLSQGFEGVTKAVYLGNAYLGERMMQGFEGMAQMTDTGFQQVNHNLSQGFEGVTQAVYMGNADQATLFWTVF